MLKLSADLKSAKYAGTEQERLNGKNIVLILKKILLEQELGLKLLTIKGANVTFLGPTRFSHSP